MKTLTDLYFKKEAQMPLSSTRVQTPALPITPPSVGRFSNMNPAQVDSSFNANKPTKPIDPRLAMNR